MMGMACLAAIFAVSAPASAAIWLVNANNVSGIEDGSTWDTAFTDIQSAVDAASLAGGGQVWVAEGLYTSGASQVVAMAADVEIYGGFAGTETADQFDTRNHLVHVTIIDGQGARRGVEGAADALIDGFLIRHGAPTTTIRGGGMQCLNVSPIISNCTFQANTAEEGGGLALVKSAAQVRHCRFFANTASESGGALYASSSTGTISHSLFVSNTADHDGGAALCSGSTNLLFSDCTFASNKMVNGGSGDGGAVAMMGLSSSSFSGCRFIGNQAGHGGALFSEDGHFTAVNSVFMHNIAGYSGAVHKWGDGNAVLTNCTVRRNWGDHSIYLGADLFRMTNCIVWDRLHYDVDPARIISLGYWGSKILTYNCIEGGQAGEGNIDVNPSFLPHYSTIASELSYDPATFTSTATWGSATLQPGTLAGQVMELEGEDQWGDPMVRGYLILTNDTKSITVWGDATEGGAFTAPVSFTAFDWRVDNISSCIDSGRDTSGPAYGSVTTDIDGVARGQDGRGDGPTGPPPPGDRSDYDMGAAEVSAVPDLAVIDITFDPPAPQPGQEFTMLVTVMNLGFNAAGPSVLSIEMTGDDAPLTYPVPSLGARESYVVERKATLAEGDGYSVTAIADCEGDVPADPNPANNTMTRLFNVHPPAWHVCDINRSGKVDAVDVQLVVNAALGLDIGGLNADVNGENGVNAVDVQLVINAALGIL
jgi:predicted outer membrane repeat protein